MSTLEARRDQMFPRLDPGEIDRLRRFGEPRRFSAGERLFGAGEPTPGMFVILRGAVSITAPALGRVVLMSEAGPGSFIAEVGQLSGRPSFVDAVARGEVAALLIPAENLRALVIAEAELGERIMRALILRRVALIESGAGGPVLIGSPVSADVVRLGGFWRATDIRISFAIPTRISRRESSSRATLRSRRPAAGDLPQWDRA